jgi:hypothetical protein
MLAPGARIGSFEVLAAPGAGGADRYSAGIARRRWVWQSASH